MSGDFREFWHRCGEQPAGKEFDGVHAKFLTTKLSAESRLTGWPRKHSGLERAVSLFAGVNLLTGTGIHAKKMDKP
jgi:hypothetical protein